MHVVTYGPNKQEGKHMRLTYRVYSATNGVQKIKTKTAIVLTAVGLVVGGGGGLAMTMLGTAGAAPNTTVNQANPQGWAFFDDNGNGGSGSFVNGPGTPPLGNGSAELDLTASNQGYALGYSGYGGTKLSNITKLSYSTYVQQGNNTVAPALQLNIDSDVTDSNTAWQGRLVYEPYYTHSVTDGTWQTWNTQDNAMNGSNGNWWFSNGSLASQTGCSQSTPCTWSQVLSKLPNVGVNGGVNAGLDFKAGSGWTAPFKGNVDAFTIGVSGNDTTYNFEALNCDTVTTSKGTLTAAQVGGNVTGDLDAHGCDIGVYYNRSHAGHVNNASIHDANGYGVFVDGNAGNVSVAIHKSHVFNIGNHVAGNYTPNGVQTGIGVFYNDLGLSGRVNGDISNNSVDKYQKGGIVANGEKTDINVENNVVTGAGPAGYIGQNGIQVSRGATGDINGNTVSENAYTGANEASAAGILVYGGWGSPLSHNVTVKNNKLVNNDVGVYFAEYNGNASGPAATPTRNSASDNWIFDSAVTNTTGMVASNGNFGYQAGLADVGNRDSACDNTILGPGYVDQGSYNSTSNTVTPGPDHAVVRSVDAGYTFPTTDFGTCRQHGNQDGDGHYNDSYVKQYRNNHKHWWY